MLSLPLLMNATGDEHDDGGMALLAIYSSYSSLSPHLLLHIFLLNLKVLSFLVLIQFTHMEFLLLLLTFPFFLFCAILRKSAACGMRHFSIALNTGNSHNAIRNFPPLSPINCHSEGDATSSSFAHFSPPSHPSSHHSRPHNLFLHDHLLHPFACTSGWLLLLLQLRK